MAYNLSISVGTPLLTPGMSFRVRYRTPQSSSWNDFLPNPTTNDFVIPNLTEQSYIVEIRTVCKNGNISAPKFIETNCGPKTGVPPEIEIVWHDTQDAIMKHCEDTCSFGI